MNEETQEKKEEDTYFFDTYALFRIIEGNTNYGKYRDSKAITTIFNLAELNYNLKKEKDKKTADDLTKKYRDFLVEVSLEDLEKAMDLKIKYKDLSIPDVIGYIIAKKHGIKFLTGDEGFRNFENVEFVKK